jgi:ABC-type oligopeptide transport system substrate-binding subunit
MNSRQRLAACAAMTLFACALVTACGGGSNSSDSNADVLPTTYPKVNPSAGDY